MKPPVLSGSRQVSSGFKRKPQVFIRFLLVSREKQQKPHVFKQKLLVSLGFYQKTIENWKNLLYTTLGVVKFY
jgi:hypothetical protein